MTLTSTLGAPLTQAEEFDVRRSVDALEFYINTFDWKEAHDLLPYATKVIGLAWDVRMAVEKAFAAANERNKIVANARRLVPDAPEMLLRELGLI